MSNLERWLSEAFPTWTWTVSGARDNATVYGRRDGFEPIRIDIMALPAGGLVGWMDVRDHRFRGDGADVKALVASLLDAVTKTEAAMKLYRSALRSMSAKKVTP